MRIIEVDFLSDVSWLRRLGVFSVKRGLHVSSMLRTKSACGRKVPKQPKLFLLFEDLKDISRSWQEHKHKISYFPNAIQQNAINTTIFLRTTQPSVQEIIHSFLRRSKIQNYFKTISLLSGQWTTHKVMLRCLAQNQTKYQHKTWKLCRRKNRNCIFTTDRVYSTDQVLLNI